MSLPADLAFASASALAQAIRTRRASAREVLQAHLARIDRLNPTLGAVVRRNDEHARARALAADEALSRGESWGPLHGVPFTLKDQHETAAMGSSFGAKGTDRAPTRDGIVAERLQAAGGIVMGKTSMALNVQGLSELHGRAVNPWSPDRVAGGSSGGAAAAVAARLTPFDVGNDATGSIRMPAHFCGVFGLRPTIGRIPSVGMSPALPGLPHLGREITTAGPIARSAEDVAFLLRVLAGPDPRDPGPASPRPALEPRDLRIAFAPDFSSIPIARSMRRVLEAAAQRLAAAGARVEERPPPLAFSEVLAAFRALFRPAMEALATSRLAPPGTQVPQGTATAIDWFAALDERDRIVGVFEDWLGDHQVLLCPAAISAAFPTGAVGSPVAIDGEVVASTFVDHPCLPATTFGAPALVVPVGRDADGLPVGAQLVGRRWEDATVITTGAAVVTAVGPMPPPPLATGEVR